MVDDSKLDRDEYPFKSNFLKIKDYNYHYIDEGKGKVIIMLHGNPTWSFYYRNLIKEYSKTHRVIAPDHMGCGLSDKPQDYKYKLKTHIDNVERLISHLKITEFTLLVHDWGGAIGMGVATRNSNMISGLIILNSAAFSLSHMPFRIAVLRTPFIGEFLIRYFNVFCWAATFMTTTKKMPKNIIDSYIMPYDNYNNRVAINSFVQDIPLNPEDSSHELIVQIERGLWLNKGKPICIIWGMKDWCFTPDFLKNWKTYYPQAEVLELEEAGHYVIEDEPNKAIEFISQFLKKNKLF